MKEKAYQYPLANGDLVVIEVRLVGNEKFKDGVMFTFRCMSSGGQILFAVENSHGKPHIHKGARKEGADLDWKAAFAKFDEMLLAHKKKTANW
jgi:hypothetical protein